MFPMHFKSTNAKVAKVAINAQTPPPSGACVPFAPLASLALKGCSYCPSFLLPIVLLPICAPCVNDC